MEANEILKTLREKHGLTQEQLAEKVLVTRQAVSRWENGETQPNTETLKLLSRLFDVSINTLLGAPRTLICTWCYTGGTFVYTSKDMLLDFLLAHSPNPDSTPEPQRRAMYDGYLSQLKHWR